MYQHIMDQMLVEFIVGVTAIINDILITGRNVKKHDDILEVESANCHNFV